ncbi:MAG: hypothetical protein RLZZ15_4178 [Verrucomicrobiota bacterium]|jgi:signal transduction histidine kinase
MLRTRLYLGLLPLVLILIGTGLYAVRQSRELADALSRDLAGNYRAIFALQQMREAVRTMHAAAAEPPRAADPRAGARVFEEQRAAFARALRGQAATSVGSPRAEAVAALERAFQAFVVAANAGVRPTGAAALADLRQREAAYFAVLNGIDALTRRDAALAQQIIANVSARAATTERVLFTSIAAAVLLSLIVAWRLAAALLKPIKTLTASATALGEGDLEHRVPEFSRDELGQLARAFNTMAAKLRDYRGAMQARVLRTQRTMEATLTSAPDPVFVVERDGTVAVRNPAAETLAAANPWERGLPEGVAEPLARVLATGEHYVPTDYGRGIALRVGREDRHYLPRILAIGDPLADFKGAAVILQDVTKFRLLDDAKTNLVGTVSHELKTPLTSLRMAVYLLLEQKLDGLTATQRDLLETARDEADRLLRILDNLLDLTRLEAGAAALERHEATVGEILAPIVAEARGLVGAAGLKLAVDAAPGAGGAVLSVDATRLRHVFMNLLTNAAKFSPPGATITLGAQATAEDFVRFSVRDEGPGVPAESGARVFERFFRVPAQEKPGAGLGLAIAREIVVAHGGSIGCTSEPGRGAEFFFLLPQQTVTATRETGPG